MELLKQLEQKIQGLLAQRNELRDELGRIKAEQGGQDEEILHLRRRVDEIQGDYSALLKEREEVKKQVEDILKQLEALA